MFDVRKGHKGAKREVSLKRQHPFSLLKDGKRLPKSSGKSSVKSSVKTTDQIIERMSANVYITTSELAKAFNLTTRAIEKQISSLREKGRLKRVGPARGGYWEVIEKSSDPKA